MSSNYRNVEICKKTKNVSRKLYLFIIILSIESIHWIRWRENIVPKQVPEFQIVPKAVHVFYNILNLVAINAWVIYKDVTIWQLAKELGGIYENEDESTSTIYWKPFIPIRHSGVKEQRKCRYFAHVITFVNYQHRNLKGADQIMAITIDAMQCNGWNGWNDNIRVETSRHL